MTEAQGTRETYKEFREVIQMMSDKAVGRQRRLSKNYSS